MKARVFLSCGQSRHSDEAELAADVAHRIGDLGFDCYIAISEQSLLGLRENIFSQLEASDYFVFVDFKRERLDIAGSNEHRGSLFSHQELGIASYLQMPALIIQEDGVKQRDGMLNALQANAIPFSDRRHLGSLVDDQLRQRIKRHEWTTKSRNALTLHLPDRPPSDAVWPNGQTARHFHISVRNNHWRKQAINCFAYLESAVNLGDNNPIQLETIEFKWAGTGLPSVRIAPSAARRFDAFWFIHATPVVLGFNCLTDSTEYYPKLPGVGRYRITYAVVSQNFEPAQKSFILEFGETLDSVKFAEV